MADLVRIDDQKAAPHAAQPKKEILTVQFFCGKGTPLKRYNAYFNGQLHLVQIPGPAIVLCHSLGIVEALKSDAKHIIAMDPTILSSDKRVSNWVPVTRKDPGLTNVTLYEMPKGLESRAHYPYESKSVRDKILKLICELSAAKALPGTEPSSSGTRQ